MFGRTSVDVRVLTASEAARNLTTWSRQVLCAWAWNVHLTAIKLLLLLSGVRFTACWDGTSLLPVRFGWRVAA